MDPTELGTPAAEAPAAEVPVAEEVAAVEEAEPAEETETVAQVVLDADGHKIYPSLFDTIPTSFAAIMIGVLIIGGIQWMVRKIFEKEKKEHKALTQFVTSMFAFIVGIWIADKLIAGPSAQLLWENESRDVLNFIKDITLMVFAYYFGTKAQVPQDDGGEDG
jgi:hypothetical protein